MYKMWTVYLLLEINCIAGNAAKMEQEHVENQLEASRELLKESEAYLMQRRSFVDSILTGMNHYSLSSYFHMIS